MSNPINIQDELRSLESSLPVNNIQPFTVPEGYFEGLPAAILAKLKNTEVSADAELQELSPLLAGIPKRTPYAVPSSYFENTVEDFSGLTQESDSPILNAIGKNTPYQAPESYFDGLAKEILAKVSKPQAKVVPLFARTWMRVASAAAVAGALFFGGYQLLVNNDREVTPGVAQQTTIANDQNLLANNSQPLEKEIRQVSTKELEDFIATVQPGTESIVDEKSTSDKNEVEELLKDVSTNEMESFLSAMPLVDEDILTIN